MDTEFLHSRSSVREMDSVLRGTMEAVLFRDLGKWAPVSGVCGCLRYQVITGVSTPGWKTYDFVASQRDA